MNMQNFHHFRQDQNFNPSSSQTIQNSFPQQTLSHKVYSFQDPMFESFGHNEKFLEKKKYPIVKINQNSRIQQKPRQKQEFNINDLAQKLSLFDAMFKIPKNILHPSVLAINSQNKQKTEMIIQFNKNNPDPKVKNICENARKYLKILHSIDQQYNKQLSQCKLTQVKNRQDSRIQFKYHQNSEISLQKSRKRSKFEHVQIKNSNKVSQQKKFDQTINTFSRFRAQQIQKDFTTTSNSKYFSEKNHLKVDESAYSAQKMFKRIQTPKIFSINLPKQRSSSQIQLSSFTKMNPKIKLEPNKRAQKDRQVSKSPKVLPKDKSKSSKQLSLQNRSKSPLGRKKFEKFEKPQKITIAKNHQQKVKAVKVDIFANKQKSLALKTVNQTNQFQKMLKMTSSRIN